MSVYDRLLERFPGDAAMVCDIETAQARPQGWITAHVWQLHKPLEIGTRLSLDKLRTNGASPGAALLHVLLFELSLIHI